MLSATYNFRHTANLQGILLSVILAISISAVVVPVASNSLSGVTPNAVQKISKYLVEAVKDAAAAEHVDVIVQVTDKVEVAAAVEELGG